MVSYIDQRNIQLSVKYFALPNGLKLVKICAKTVQKKGLCEKEVHKRVLNFCVNQM